MFTYFIGKKIKNLNNVHRSNTENFKIYNLQPQHTQIANAVECNHKPVVNIRKLICHA